LPTEDLRDLAPCYGVGRYDYGGQQAVETTAAALAACGQVVSLPVGPGGAAGAQELFEVPGALLLPDRTGPGTPARTQDGKRLFVAAELMDLSGSCQVRIAEEPALMLANVEKAEEFEAQLKDGSLQLSRARVRVRREVRGSAVYLTVGEVVPDLAVGTPRALPLLTPQCVMPARVSDIVPYGFGGLAVRLGDALLFHRRLRGGDAQRQRQRLTAPVRVAPRHRLPQRVWQHYGVARGDHVLF
jgi:hypothetical protein